MKIKLIILSLILGIVITSSYLIYATTCEYNLSGNVIYIDAGHGGKDNGASNGNINEDSINFSISKLLVKKLIDLGAYVYTSRDGDYDLASNYDKNRKAKDLKRRVELINFIKPDLFISIHMNTYISDEEVSGGQAFYQDNEKSKLLANILQDKFNELSNKKKKAKSGDYYLLNKTKYIGVLLECGFLTNDEELKKLSTLSYQSEIVENIVDGIGEYLSNKML